MPGAGGLAWRTGVLWLSIFAIILLVGAALFLASGIYNVAASSPHLAISERLIEFVLRRSVATHSLGVTAPDLDDEGLVRLGANHFRNGCAPCHGSPTSSNNPIVERMYPAPPPLSEAVATWTTEELFRIVRHGLKFTGMPAWPGEGRDDEVWALVAFLQRLPQMDEQKFRALVGQDSALIALGEPQAPRLDLCASCHGGTGARPVSDLVPPLQGQSAAYLRRSLDEYRNDLRQSGIMEPVAAALNDRSIGEFARHYAAGAPPPSTIGQGSDPEAIRRGRAIAERGIPEQHIPPCLACHSGRASDQFPVLAGLSATYISGQLEIFRKGLRDRTAYGAIMNAVAKRLAPSAIADVAAYFSSLPIGGKPPENRETGRR